MTKKEHFKKIALRSATIGLGGVGAGIGAGIGYLKNRKKKNKWKKTLIGAGIGAASGGTAGALVDRSHRKTLKSMKKDIDLMRQYVNTAKATLGKNKKDD